jgi:lysophospholipase-2
VSLNQGQLRPSWFNISRLPPGHDEFDEIALTESVTLIENLILSQVHSGIDSRKIVLVGFSQGAALSMIVSLTTLHELGGVASLSGWIPHRARDVSYDLTLMYQSLRFVQFVKQIIHAAPNLPILWCHGNADAEIPISYAEDAISFLYYALHVPYSKLRFRKYDGLKHAINDVELDDLASWLERILA